MKKFKKCSDNPKADESTCSVATTSLGTGKCRRICRNSRSGSSSISSGIEPATKRYDYKLFCGKREGKQVCQYVEQFPTYKTDKPKKCHPKSKEPSYMQVFREEFCPKEKSASLSSTLTTKSCVCTPSKVSASKKLTDTRHMPSIKHEDPINGRQWKKPCKASDFDDKKDYFIGKCTKEQLEIKPPKRPDWTPEFNITEDPRKTQCLKNPRKDLRPQKLEERCKEISEQIYLADNFDTPSVSEESKSICVEMDLDNPLGLDFQGTDYQYTYLKDEQNIEDQKEYIKQKRHIDRRVLKTQIGDMIEIQQHKENVATPKLFDIHQEYDSDAQISQLSINITRSRDIRGEEEEEVGAEKRMKLANLLRTQNKPINCGITDFENETRFGRYYSLFMSKSEKEKEKAARQAELDRIAEENLNFNIVENDLDELVLEKQIEIKAKFESLPQIQRRRWYPHNLKETKHFRSKMKKSKRILRDKAIIRKEFYKEHGIEKTLKEADLVISEGTTSSENLSEQSTEDEDDISVGPKEPGKYYLRGFNFKLGTEPRGKLHLTQKREAGREFRTCQTRSEWFESLAPKGRAIPFNQYNVSSVAHHQSPDDPRLQLFPPLRPQPVECAESPIKNFVKEPIGIQYNKGKTKTVKVKKPNYVKVKKFNLTGYLFGEAKGRGYVSESSASSQYKGELKQLHEYMHTKNKVKTMLKRRQRRQRMHYLGIPVTTAKKRKKIDACMDLKSEDSDWIPEQEKIAAAEKVDILLASKLTMYRSEHIRICTGPVLNVKNVPAPKFREPTLRQHPRRPRIVSPCSGESEIIENADMPVLQAPPDDIKIEANLNERKTEYTDIFDARRHHDHADPTQHKAINVKYVRKVPEITVENITVEQPKTRKQRPFEKAMPQGPEPEKFVDLSLPQIEYEEISLKEKKPQYQSVALSKCGQHDATGIIESRPDKIYRSAKKPTKEYPAQQKYLKLIRDMAREIKKRLANVEDVHEEFAVDKEAYLKELEDEIKSINSCVTSLESSICTNFTNDSGSFLLVQDTKIPLDYIRKSLVPFEEIDRTRVKASIRHANAKYYEPYRTVPFAGQNKELRMSSKGNSDKFFTFNTRIRNGLRARLEVEPVDLKKTPLGTEKVKALAQVATDLDENYMNDLNQSISRRTFRLKSSMALIKDALRKKYEVWNIQSQIVEQQIAENKETQYAEDITKLNKMLDRLFSKWEKKEYDKSKSKTRIVKMYYEATDFMKKERLEYEKEYTRLNMQIVFTEDDWIRRIRLQNFHYLLMKNSWREENDWIHQKEDGTLENYRESIEKRKTANIRVRERDDAWAIKEFYENHYLKNNHPIVIVFPYAENFNRAVEKLKIRTFVCLLELHYTIWILINLEHAYRQYLKWSEDFVTARSKFVSTKCAKKYFMEERAEKLKTIAMHLLEEPLRESISSPRLRQIRSTGNVVYNRVVPENIRRNVKQDLDIVQKMGMIFEVITEILAKLEEFPTSVACNIERKYRARFAYDQRISSQAYKVEKRILLTAAEIKRNMAPPFKKPKGTAKLKRLMLKKKKIVEAPRVKRLSQKTVFFCKAFVPDDDERSVREEDEDLLAVNTNIQDTVIPFYFDHFLRLNNYEPNYNFKTQVELTYGPEEKPFRYKRILPEVYRKMAAWEAYKKKKMESDIRKTTNLYTNVQV